MSDFKLNDLGEYRRLYEKGYTAVQIAAYFEVSAPTMYDALRRAGTVLRPQNTRAVKNLPALVKNARAPWTPEEDKILSQRAEWGFTYEEIGKQLGRSMHSCKVRAHKIGSVDKTGKRRQDRLAEKRNRKKGAKERDKIGRKSRRRALAPGMQEDFGRRMHDPQTRAVAVAALRRRLRGYDVPPEREDEYKYYKKTKKMTPAEIRGVMGL